MKTPIFEIGQQVKSKLKNQTQGTIVAIEKIYQEVDANGNFLKHGIRYCEDIFPYIPSLNIETIDEENAVVRYTIGESQRTERIRFIEYTYTLVIPGASYKISFLEKQLRKLK